MVHLFTVRFTFHRSLPSELFFAIFSSMPESELVYLVWLQIREIFEVCELSALSKVRQTYKLSTGAGETAESEGFVISISKSPTLSCSCSLNQYL